MIGKIYFLPVHTGLRLLFGLWLSLGSVSVGLASDRPSVEEFQPVVGMRGSQFEIRAIGSCLKNASEILFYQKGLHCLSIEAISDEELCLKIQADHDCPVGIQALRIRTPGGLSELRTISISQFPIVIVPGPSNQEIPLVEVNHTVAGKLSGNGVDRFHVDLKQNQRCSIEVEAMRLGIAMLDTALVIRKEDGQIVASSDDAPGLDQDPGLSFIAPSHGRYTIEVKEAGASRADGAPYLLHVGDFPRPSSIYPLGGQLGERLEVELDSGLPTVSHQTIEFPNEASGIFRLFPSVGNSHSPTYLPLRLSSYPATREQEPNNTLESNSQILVNTGALPELPHAFDGRLQAPGDRDCFWFNAHQGQVVNVEVFASRLGSPIDSVITLFDASKKILAQADDFDSHDSRLVIPIELDGAIGVAIEDKRKEGGPGYVYRIEVTLAQPEVEAFLPRRDRLSQNRQTIDIPSGNRVLAFLGVRTTVEGGQATLQFPHLPAGVRAIFSPMNQGEYLVPVVLEASENLPPMCELVSVRAQIEKDGSEVQGGFRQVIDLVSGPADAIYKELSTDRIALSIIEPTPFEISVDEPETHLSNDGTLDLCVRAKRSAGFDQAIEIEVPWLPPWVDAEPKLVIPSGQSIGFIKLRAWKQAGKNRWPLVLEASTYAAPSEDARMAMIGAVASLDPAVASITSLAVASRPIQLQIDESPVAGQLSSVAGEQGESVTFGCSLNYKQPLTGKWVASIEGLPNRVQCESIGIDSSPPNLNFTITLDASAPIGTFPGLACRLSGKVGGQSVSYVISRQGQLTIAKPGSIVRGSNGQPLNRLEVLRRQRGELR